MPNLFREYGIQLWPSTSSLSPPLAKTIQEQGTHMSPTKIVTNSHDTHQLFASSYSFYFSKLFTLYVLRESNLGYNSNVE